MTRSNSLSLWPSIDIDEYTTQSWKKNKQTKKLKFKNNYRDLYRCSFESSVYNLFWESNSAKNTHAQCYQWYDWYQWKSTLFQWFCWWICISLRRLRLFSYVVYLGTEQLQWSIATNGTIGTNRKAPYSNGSVGEYASH